MTFYVLQNNFHTLCLLYYFPDNLRKKDFLLRKKVRFFPVVLPPMFSEFFRTTKPKEINRKRFIVRNSHMTMKAEKSHNLPSASWRPRKIRVTVQAWKPGNQASQWCKTQFQLKSKDQKTRSSNALWQEKMDVTAQAENKRVHLSPIVFFRSSTDWMVPTCIGEGDLYSVNQSKCWYLLTNTPRNHVLPATWISLIQSSWYIKLIIAHSMFIFIILVVTLA